ncbi:MAG: hypothetical protein RL329_1265 [Bacteroidota bacterium]|jgi:hypothetical protein
MLENQNNPLFQPVASLISRDFELATQQPRDIAAFLAYLADVIAYMLEHQTDKLFGLMYRLDIDEYKIQIVLAPFHPEPPPVGLARLVWERQLERVRTRKTYTSPPVEDEWRF